MIQMFPPPEIMVCWMAPSLHYPARYFPGIRASSAYDSFSTILAQNALRIFYVSPLSYILCISDIAQSRRPGKYNRMLILVEITKCSSSRFRNIGWSHRLLILGGVRRICRRKFAGSV
jgi:hypothetical protein